MEKISVKAVKGRKAFTAPRGGVSIPHDRYITVDKSPYIDRLLNHHGDIALEPSKPKPKEPKPELPNAPVETK
jgi:hypothetical protein